jgi:hypothetical protein
VSLNLDMFGRSNSELNPILADIQNEDFDFVSDNKFLLVLPGNYEHETFCFKPPDPGSACLKENRL